MSALILKKLNLDYNKFKDRWITFFNKTYEYGKNRIPYKFTQDKNVKKPIEILYVMSFEKKKEMYMNMSRD